MGGGGRGGGGKEEGREEGKGGEGRGGSCSNLVAWHIYLGPFCS